MSIKRYLASKSNTITNAYKPGMSNRGTGSAMGLSDTVNVFHIYAQQASASSELSRALYKFPTSGISTDRTNAVLPVSGSVSFYLRLFNAEHPFTLPRNFTLSVLPVSRSWDGGVGIDTDEFSDSGYCNWEKAASASSGITDWTTDGGDFHTATYVPASTLPNYTQIFTSGEENLEVDITSLVEEWLAGTKNNDGVGIKLTDGTETALSSSYVKKFFAKETEYFHKRPVIEARWDSSKKDQRANFYASSSLVDATDNLQTLYLYNYVRGQLKNIPDIGTDAIYVRFFTSASNGLIVQDVPTTGGYVSAGVYSASVALDTTSSLVYDVWYGASLKPAYHTGSEISVKSFVSEAYENRPDYVLSMTNLKNEYHTIETARFRLFTRKKNWKPNVYTVMNVDAQTDFIEDLYYRIVRSADDEIVVDYGTGSVNHTRLSYDASGSYFDLSMDTFEKDHQYQIEYLYKVSSTEYREISNKFKFRIIE